MWVARNNIERIAKATSTRPVVLLIGVRQSGKSSLLKKLYPKAEYITLDNISYSQEAEESPSHFLKKFEGQTIIDEIQYAPSLFRDLKILVDENRREKGKWIITGSQQFALMEKVSESLAGRVRIINLGTLNSTELNNAGLLEHQRQDFLWKGGFPEVWAESLDPVDFFEDYIQTYLERDLRQILNVTNLRDFRRFLSILAVRVGQLLNYSEVSKDIGVSVNTIKNWVSALEASGLIILLQPYYNNLGKRLIKAPKVYFCDSGLACSLLNINSQEALQNSIYTGAIWENMVLNEFIKNGLISGKNLFYFRDQNGVEVDFIVEKDGKTYLIEAKSSERPNPQKLNFRKIAPLFKQEPECVLACNVLENRKIRFKDYSIYNPLYGYYAFD